MASLARVTVACLFAAAALLVGVGALDLTELYDEDSAVTILGGDDFHSAIVESDVPAVVAFHAAGCAACETMATQLNAVAEKMGGMVDVAAINCHEGKAEIKVCEQYKVMKVPAILIFPAEKKHNPYTKKYYKEPTEYDGDMSARTISQAAQKVLVDTYVTHVKSVDDFEKWRAGVEPGKAGVLLVTSKKDTTPLYRAMSIHFRGKFDFAQLSTAPGEDGVAPSVDEVRDEVGLSEGQSLPYLVILHPDGTQTPYPAGDAAEGKDVKLKFNAIDLADWLKAHAPPDLDEELSKEREAKDRAAKETPQYAVTDMAGLEDDVCEKEDVALVAFYKGADCADAVQEEIQALGKGLAGQVALYLVDATDAEAGDLAQYNVAAAGLEGCGIALALLPWGDDKLEGDEDIVAWPASKPLESKAVAAWAHRALPDLTHHVDEENYQRFLSIVPGGVHPFTLKCILFIPKGRSPPGTYKALAANLRRLDIAFGWVTKEEAGMAAVFQNVQYPGMQLFYVDPDGAPDAGGNVELHAQPFDAPLKYGYMATWLTVVHRQLRGDRADADDDYDDADDAAPASGKAGDVVELVSDADFESRCAARGGICVVAHLDAQSTDAAALAEPLAALGHVALRRRGAPISFMWVDAPRQPAFAAAFGLASIDDFPSLVALAPKKERYAILASRRISQDEIDASLDKMLSGQTSTNPMQGGLPSLVDGGVAPEEALGAEAFEEVEEEFDLSDVMEEEVDGEGLKSKEQLLKEAEEAVAAEEAAKKAAAEAEAEAAAKKAAKKKKKSKKKKKKGGKDEL